MVNRNRILVRAVPMNITHKYLAFSNFRSQFGDYFDVSDYVIQTLFHSILPENMSLKNPSSIHSNYFGKIRKNVIYMKCH